MERTKIVKSSRILLLVALVLACVALVLALVFFDVVRAGDGGNQWEFVVDVEARSSGEVLATRQVRTSICEGDGESCIIAWDWEGESFPANAEEWVKPYFLDCGETVPVVFIPYWCDVDLELCQAKLVSDGTVIIVEPSAECLTALASVCGLESDERGFWYGGTIGNDAEYHAFYEPISLYGEWYDDCSIPPPTLTPWPTAPTLTPWPTYTPDPTPTCQPTWTPIPTDTPYPTATPEPTATEYPTQPPF